MVRLTVLGGGAFGLGAALEDADPAGEVPTGSAFEQEGKIPNIAAQKAASLTPSLADKTLFRPWRRNVG